MALRQPPQLESPPEIESLQSQGLQWSTLDCELVTPMYGGGVSAHTVDAAMPIRVSAIRGQLRFWWRLLAQHNQALGFKGVSEMRKAEFDLWGGVGDSAKASKVFLRVSNVLNKEVEAWAVYEPNHNGRDVLRPRPWANVPYVLFPAQGRTTQNPQEEPHDLMKAGLSWQLQLAFSSQVTDTQREHVWEALRWWSNFGGLGARTRRGLGAVKVTYALSPDLLRSISQDDAERAGCKLVIRNGANSKAYDAWTDAVGKMQSFRQGVGLGRNPGQQGNRPGRSRWPEPDAVRRIMGRNAPVHTPSHPAGNIFPRAAFGLPIIFHFQGGGDPGDSTLNPTGLERMASPIILRPYLRANGLWSAAALLLPHQHINAQLALELKYGHTAAPAIYWNPLQAKHIYPIEQNSGGAPLAAFLQYFEKN